MEWHIPIVSCHSLRTSAAHLSVWPGLFIVVAPNAVPWYAVHVVMGCSTTSEAQVINQSHRPVSAICCANINTPQRKHGFLQCYSLTQSHCGPAPGVVQCTPHAPVLGRQPWPHHGNQNLHHHHAWHCNTHGKVWCVELVQEGANAIVAEEQGHRHHK